MLVSSHTRPLELVPQMNRVGEKPCGLLDASSSLSVVARRPTPSETNIGYTVPMGLLCFAFFFWNALRQMAKPALLLLLVVRPFQKCM